MSPLLSQPDLLLTSSTALAGHADRAETTWHGLYACSNGWRTLRPGCFDILDLPSVNCLEDFNFGYPTHCTLDGRDLGWTAAAGDASELLVVDAWEGVQVILRLALAFALQIGARLAEKPSYLPGNQLQDETAAADVQLREGELLPLHGCAASRALSRRPPWGHYCADLRDGRL